MTPISPSCPSAAIRIDKWLWCARFYKTRAIAAQAIAKGHVKINQASAKPGKDVRVGDTVALQQAGVPKTVVVQALAATRGPAPQARQLYAETADSAAERARLAEQRRIAPEPASAQRQGRPTKRDRRNLQELQEPHQWDSRWTAQ